MERSRDKKRPITIKILIIGLKNIKIQTDNIRNKLDGDSINVCKKEIVGNKKIYKEVMEIYGIEDLIKNCILIIII